MPNLYFSFDLKPYSKYPSKFADSASVSSENKSLLSQRVRCHNASIPPRADLNMGGEGADKQYSLDPFCIKIQRGSPIWQDRIDQY